MAARWHDAAECQALRGRLVLLSNSAVAAVNAADFHMHQPAEQDQTHPDLHRHHLHVSASLLPAMHHTQSVTSCAAEPANCLQMLTPAATVHGQQANLEQC